MIKDKKGQVKLFIIRAIAFLLIFLLIDFVIGKIMRYGYFSQDNKYTYGIEKTTADVIILGSSRAQHHYEPSIIHDTLGLSCFNMGSGGQNIYYHYGIISSILERYTPKIVLMDLIYIDYQITNREYGTDKLSVLLPYYKKHQPIREIIKLRGPFERIRLLSSIYPFNSQITDILYSIKKGENQPHLIKDGFIPLYGKIKEKPKNVNVVRDYAIDSLKIFYIEKTISACKQKGIRLIIINSPSIATEYESASFDVIKKIGKIDGVEVWDYTSDMSFLRLEFFHDVYHMNDHGAQEFTKAIASRLKREMVCDVSCTEKTLN